MKNAKQHETIDQGASDKGDSPKRVWSFFPKTMAEVPPLIFISAVEQFQK